MRHLQRFTSTLPSNNLPTKPTTSFLLIPNLPSNASRLGTYCASVIVRCMRSSKNDSFVLCAIAWLMASLIM